MIEQNSYKSIRVKNKVYFIITIYEIINYQTFKIIFHYLTKSIDQVS